MPPLGLKQRSLELLTQAQPLIKITLNAVIALQSFLSPLNREPYVEWKNAHERNINDPYKSLHGNGLEKIYE